MTSTPDMKPRSRDVTDGLEKAAARGMLRAVGMGDEDFKKPQIGVASLVERDHPLQPVAGPAGQGRQERRARRRWVPAGVRHHLGLRRHLDGPRGHALLAGLPRGDRRLGRDRDDGRAPRRLGAAGRLRQVAARHADGRRPPRPRQRVPVRRVDHARPGGRPGRHDHRRLRGGRRLPGRQDHPRGGGPDRAGHLSGRGRLRWHVHRQHDGLGRRGPGHVAARLRRAAGGRPAPRRVRAPLRRGGRRDAPPGHHRPPDHDPRGVRERDRRRDGARRLDQRRTPPAGHRPRGRGPARDRRLQPHRRQGPAPRRPQAVRPLRDERRRQGRRHPDGDEGTARRRPDARRRASP